MPRIAIAGNPNAGKTCIFNHLTGATHSVGNYPGVTVEREEGKARLGDRTITIIDLPGTYSLTAYSQEELVARNFIIEDGPDLVVDVVDASNLERNLYLAIQLIEMRVPLVMALNMVDVAKGRGFVIDTNRLSELLGIPVASTVGNKGTGVDALLDRCASCIERDVACVPHPVTYGHEVDEQIDAVAAVVGAVDAVTTNYDARWAAVKLIEGDPQVTERVREWARERFAGMAEGEAFDLSRFGAEAAAEETRRLVKQTPKQGAAVYVGYPGLRLTEVDDRDALDVLRQIVGSNTGWLHEELRGRGLVYYAWGINFAGLLPGYFAATAQCESEKVEEVLEAIQEQLGKARRGEFSEEEVARAKSKRVNAEVLQKQTNADAAMTAALDELYGFGYAWSEGSADRIMSVTLAEVQRVADKYLGRPATIAVVTSEPAEED